MKRLKKLLRLLAIAAPVIAAAAILTTEVAIHRAQFPSTLGDSSPGTPTYLDLTGLPVAHLATGDARLHLPVALEEMGEWLPAVTIALEDHRFEDHRGVDWYAIAAAAARNLRQPQTISGASTITQQVIKQADRRQGRHLKAKLREAVLALKLEREWDKDRVLATYLNRLDYGNRRIGPESAAMAYFGKRATALTHPEAIFLAGLPQSPSRHNPWRHPARALAKYQRSLDRLQELGLIGPDQHTHFSESPPEILRETPVNQAPQFLQAALAAAPASPGTHTTTLDLQLQREAAGMLAAQLQAINRHDVRNAAIVVIENASGAVRVLASAARSDAHGESEINGALIPRHAGSTLKPFVYLMGIDERTFTAASIFPDTQNAVARHFADYDPQNFNRGFRGPVRLREALANSMNIPAVLALDQIGARRCFYQLEDWGLHREEKFEQLGAGFVLGNLRVRLLDLTAAYAALARGGLAVPPQFDAAAAPPPQRRLAAPGSVEIIEDILCDNQARAHAFGSDSPLNLGWRAAAKTGTSSSFRDAWTVGYCRDFTVGVWVGNYDGQSMPGTLAVHTATPIWRRMMGHLKNHYGARPLALPGAGDQLVRQEIDPLSGLLPVAGGARQPEWFLPGTVPSDSASAWISATGERPQLPTAYATWIGSKHNHLGATLQPPAGGGAVLEILSPADGQTFVIDSDLPATQQSVELSALTGSEEVQWTINGRPHAGHHWQLRPGQWQVTARTRSGAEAEATFSVE